MVKITIDYDTQQYTKQIKNHEYYSDIWSDSILLMCCLKIKNYYKDCNKIMIDFSRNNIDVSHRNHIRFHDISTALKNEIGYLRYG